MGNQLCPGSAKELIQELGEIEKGEKSYEAFFKGCFDFKESKLHEILLNDSEDSALLQLEMIHDARPHFPHAAHPSHLSLETHSPQQQHKSTQSPQEDAEVQLQFEDGSKFKGFLKDGLPDGEGEEMNAQGDYYRGTFRMGVKEGRGVYRFSNKEEYEGEFRENAMWGQGVYRFANGDSYEGQFTNNERTGHGKYAFAHNNPERLVEFEGEYRADMRDGSGRLRLVDFELKGQWRNGLYEFVFDPNMLK